MTPPDPTRLEIHSRDYVIADWNRYRTLDRLANHWDRPGWSNGRRSYHWILRFDQYPSLRRLTAYCQAALQHISTLDMAPMSSLHLTLQRVAFTDEIQPAVVDAIAAVAAGKYALVPPATITVGPLAGSPGAVRFSAGPHAPIVAVRKIARAAIGYIHLAERTTAFVPHVSIAYSNSSHPAAAIIEQVASLRHADVAVVEVTSVELVELRREERAYAFDVLHSLPLQTAGQCLTTAVILRHARPGSPVLHRTTRSAPSGTFDGANRSYRARD
ncbi:2'-5' RNA ligase superfamily protein [Micromonospora pisi]|uniref:2'-5' RNA ligase superfamily protein n=1 Tax=Micromonospora pisi TaxID=589240 RepID=A0A495JJ27_9ACTN|nr:2'-5' RNA ligase family protein [Micromonospora pisi]RKR88394.1 2'-5' RNA ligase superfamily protein [Micromonospora pisi]